MPHAIGIRLGMSCGSGLAILLVLGALAGVAQEAGTTAGQEGREIFTQAQPACAICHTLADAGASGKIGPNLDTLEPTEERVRLAVRGGADGMPAYRDILSEEEIATVAEYVATVSREGGG
ncbi:c-type cytochrome [Rhodoligotrophos defluvii]|uniref:SorU family sulfite dehydrogenase c-type cytochrome subunit n=1 Tax=Rhodoligotrophos defluvii TaxID=2561934 RepID=UPI001961437B|nr:cytochrome c [Rhodoligotrophos defluvii]